MRLINKTILYYLLISLPLLLIAGVFAYFQIDNELREETDNNLIQQAFYAERICFNYDTINTDSKKISLGYENISSLSLVSYHKNEHVFSDTTMFYILEQEMAPYRMLRSYVNYNNQTFLITVVKTTIEEDDLLKGLFTTFILIVIFLILALFLVNWLLSKILWKPFYKTLDGLKAYDIKLHEKCHFEHANTLEFNQLNEALTKMTEKIYKDFSQQKEFTENASHEMQTPLAVMKAHLDLLIQSSNLKEDDMNHLQVMENTIKKLTSLNKALILLSKIDNNQFIENGLFNLNQVIEKVAENYTDLILSKKMTLKINRNEELNVIISNTLADVLISNLFQNAIRHNTTGGEISININHDSITISNTGEPLIISRDDLFVRFKKDDSSKDSLGLGLSIIKSILDSYNYSISYNYINQLHVFEVKFN